MKIYSNITQPILLYTMKDYLTTVSSYVSKVLLCNLSHEWGSDPLCRILTQKSLSQISPIWWLMVYLHHRPPQHIHICILVVLSWLNLWCTIARVASIRAKLSRHNGRTSDAEICKFETRYTLCVISVKNYQLTLFFSDMILLSGLISLCIKPLLWQASRPPAMVFSIYHLS